MACNWTREEHKMTQQKPPFNPAAYLITVEGSLYLPVQWRLAWFRAEHPHGRIQTELVHLDLEHGQAVFKAVVEDSSGSLAVGHGSENMRHFANYTERAETKAIGRALAALGFGTQWAQGD
jgi:hypothetical protein